MTDIKKNIECDSLTCNKQTTNEIVLDKLSIKHYPENMTPEWNKLGFGVEIYTFVIQLHKPDKKLFVNSVAYDYFYVCVHAMKCSYSDRAQTDKFTKSEAFTILDGSISNFSNQGSGLCVGVVATVDNHPYFQSSKSTIGGIMTDKNLSYPFKLDGNGFKMEGWSDCSTVGTFTMLNIHGPLQKY